MVSRLFSRWARLAVVLGLAVAAAASTSSQQQSNGQTMGPAAPPAQQMDATRVIGLWKSNFGAVKVDADASRGGLAAGAVHGVWMYQREGADVIGYFTGTLRGTVMSFGWQEPAATPLVGQGWLVFDPQGARFDGKWWSHDQTRGGEWNGWRQPVASTEPAASPYADPYGGNTYGGQAYPAPAPYAPY